MKIEKSNNPAAVGALVLVLLLIVGRIVWMVFGRTGSVSAASTASAASPASEAPPATVSQVTSPTPTAPAPQEKPLASTAVPTTTRNPFSIVVKSPEAMSAPDGLPQASHAVKRVTGRGEMLPVMPLPPLPIQVMETIPVKGMRSAPTARGAGPLPALPNSADKSVAALPTLKLTAIIDGTEPFAIVQTANPQPVILHIGDLLEGMRVTAIHEQEIVFARGTGFWTLPLQSAADSVAPAPTSMTSEPTAPASVISVATPEENTDELH